MAPWGKIRHAPRSHLPEAAAPLVAGTDGAQLAARLPGRVDRAGTGAGAAVRGANGPSSRRNGRWCRDHPDEPRSQVNGDPWVHSRCAAPPSGRRLRPASVRPRRTRRRRPAPVPPALGARRRGLAAANPAPRDKRPGAGACPAPRQADGPAVVERRSCQRRDRADRAVADRRERQAGHPQLDLQPRAAQPRARGVRQPGQRGARRRRRARSSTRPRRAVQRRCTGWATTRASADGSSADRLRGRPPPSRPVVRRPGTVSCPWKPTMTLEHHQGLAARLLPPQAGRQRRRGAVRPADDPRRRVHGVVRDPEQRHDVAGLQPLGRLQPVLRPRGARRADFASRPASCPSTGPTRRTGPRAQPTSWATSSRSCSTSRAWAST